MSTQNNFSRSFTANTAMSAFRRVAVSANGAIGLAAINELGIGILQEDTAAQSYENPKVRFYSTGSFKCSATGGLVTAGNTLYAVTNGQVAVTNGGTGGTVVGIALENGSYTAGEWIEIAPQ